MDILTMEDNYLEDVISVDKISFERNESRSLNNILALRQADPDGCYIMKNRAEIIGYIFSKSLGKEGYIGPVGVLPIYRGNGYGRSLIENSIEYLKRKCSTIGLEVLPTKTKNIDLYQKIGFQTAFPTLIYAISDCGIERETMIEIFQLEDLDSKSQDYILKEINSWPEREFDGASYSKDIKLAQKYRGNIFIASTNGQTVGFLVHSKTVIPYSYGVVKKVNNDREIFRNLISFAQKHIENEEILIGVNSRYYKALEIITDLNYSTKNSINRMMLSGFEGSYFTRSENISCRVWIG